MIANRRVRPFYVAAIALAVAAGLPAPGAGQDALNPAPAEPPRLNAVLDGGAFNNPGGNPNAGGSASADFDSLIDLIISTVEHESWQENGTGEGQIMPFDINGVYVDARRALTVDDAKVGAALTAVRERGLRPADGQASSATPADRDAHANSDLRYVSLPRLEAAIAQQQLEHAPLDPAMLTLAGLQRVQFVLIYPETGDLVLAGPAGSWQPGPGGSIVSAETGRPVVRLDDLMALMRRNRQERSAPFGCSIVPRQESLARTQQFLAESATRAIDAADRDDWLESLRATLGAQDVVYYHVAPDTRLARLLLAADYHMKLVGMGLADGVPGVRNYLATVSLGPGGVPPAMSVLRWWFSMPALAVQAAASRDAFALPAQCVEVLSENELLAARGQRVHTGASDDLNRRFAASFTEHYEALADRYPVYGELARVFEVALALAVIEREGLAEQVAWAPGLLLDERRLRLPQAAPVEAVDTVINHRVIAGKHIIAGVSGGVWVDGGKSLAVIPATDASDQLRLVKKQSVATEAPDGQIIWWWD